MLRPIVLLVLLMTLASACATTDRTLTGASCHKYLVMPPEHFDELASDFVLRSWTGKARHKLKKCDKIIEPEKATPVFSLVEVSHNEHFTKGDLSPGMIQSLVEKTGATDVVYIKFNITDSNDLDMVATVYQLPSLKRVTNSPLSGESSIELPATHPFREVGSFRLVDTLLNLLPNAAGLGLVASSQLTNARVEDRELVQTSGQSKGFLPPYLSTFSFVNLKHPDGMALWDYDWKLTGAMSFAYFNSVYGYAPRNSAGNQVGDDNSIIYDLLLFMMVPTVNETLSLHWPLGTTFFSLGVGPGFYSYSDSLGNHNNSAVLVWRVTTGHRVFVSERWFLNFVVSVFIPNRRLVDNEVFKMSSYGDVTFGFGYYFPELKTWGRSFF